MHNVTLKRIKVLFIKNVATLCKKFNNYITAFVLCHMIFQKTYFTNRAQRYVTNISCWTKYKDDNSVLGTWCDILEVGFLKYTQSLLRYLKGVLHF